MDYEGTKKIRRIAAIVYVLMMAFLVGGTYLSQQQKIAGKSGQNEPGFQKAVIK